MAVRGTVVLAIGAAAGAVGVQSWQHGVSADATAPTAAAAATAASDGKTASKHSLYIWGDNINGIHPECTDETIVQPTPVKFFDGKRLKSVSLGFRHAAAVDDKGDVFQWGSAFGASTAVLLAPPIPDGIGSRSPLTELVTPVCTLKGFDATQVFCGFAKTFVLTRKGKLFAMPVSNDIKVTAMPLDKVPDKNVSSSPPTLPSPEPQSWSGWVSSFWQPSSSALTASSSSSSSLVPLNSIEIVLPPAFSQERIVKVTGGYNHIMVLTESGKVFAGAQNAFANQVGQLGLGFVNDTPTFFNPNVTPQELIPVPFDAPVADVACGAAHTVLLTARGEAYSFGANRLGQLGLGQFKESQLIAPSPTRVALPADGKCTHIAAGGDNVFFVMETPSKSELFVSGTGLYGQLGIGQTPHVKTEPTLVQTLSRRQFYDEQRKVIQPIRIADLSVGQRHVAAVLDTSYVDTTGNSTIGGLDVWTWGYNRFYQLGLRTRAATSLPQPTRSLHDANEAMQLSHNNGRILQSIVCGYDTTAVFTLPTTGSPQK